MKIKKMKDKNWTDLIIMDSDKTWRITHPYLSDIGSDEFTWICGLDKSTAEELQKIFENLCDASASMACED